LHITTKRGKGHSDQKQLGSSQRKTLSPFQLIKKVAERGFHWHKREAGNKQDEKKFKYANNSAATVERRKSLLKNLLSEKAALGKVANLKFANDEDGGLSRKRKRAERGV